jgi:hypothetical protein
MYESRQQHKVRRLFRMAKKRQSKNAEGGRAGCKFFPARSCCRASNTRRKQFGWDLELVQQRAGKPSKRVSTRIGAPDDQVEAPAIQYRSLSYSA